MNFLKRYIDRRARAVSEDMLAEFRRSFAGDADAMRGIAQSLMTVPTIWNGDWSRVTLGANVHLVNALLNVSSGTISIGDDTFFGHNVSLITGTHFIARKGPERQDYPKHGRDITIGKGVWIASNALVLGPCTIGDHAVIAAGAVVVGGELEPGAIYAGVPARRLQRSSAAGN